MNLLAAALMVIVFSLLLHVTHIVSTTKEVLDVSRQSLHTLQSSVLSDAEKEHAIKSSSVSMFKLLGAIIAKTTIALATPIAMVWLIDVIGWISLDEVLSTLAKPSVIVASVILGTVSYLAINKTLNRNG